MLIRKMKLKEIKPADYNPRLDLQPGDEEYEKLKRSIQEFSLVEPLVWNERTCRLVGGHQRLKVLEELGYEEVEVSVVDLPDEKEKALNVALNKIQGDWDYEKLEILLAELSDAGVDLGITGFDEMDEFLDIDIESEYTKKAETPVYEITGECPELSELVDSDRAEYLIQSIFTQFDDDYTHFEYKYIEDGKLKPRKIVAAKGDSLGNRLFEAMIDFLEVSGVKTVAFAQGGDYIGGKDNYNFRRGFMRKAMNTFFCKTDRRINFVGRINEDTTTYCLEGSRGGLFLTIMKVSVDQTQTQKQKGGLTDTYLDLGTYVKSFYSVMYMPSCVKVSAMGNVDYRLHHSVSWNNCVPKILREDYKKVE